MKSLRWPQSELGAVDAPHALFINAGFVGLGVVLLGFAVAYVVVLRAGP